MVTARMLNFVAWIFASFTETFKPNLPNNPSLSDQPFRKIFFENIMEGENGGNKHIIIYSQ